MDRTKNKKTGNLGEDLACEYLEKKRYKILERNLDLGLGEVDILATPPRDKETVVLVEVKTVKGFDFGPAKELVRRKKKEKLKLLAKVLEQKYPQKTIRIDVIGVLLAGEEPEFEHIENAVN